MKNVKESYYNNGQFYRHTIINDELHGISAGWYSNGRLEYRINYSNGQRHGLDEWWYIDGRQLRKKYKLL